MDLAIVAGRVSTKDQADKGYSLPGQVEKCLAHIEARGYRLAGCPGYSNVESITERPGIFIEDYTGTMIDRPALDAMREAVRPYGITKIIFTEMDRLNRGPSWQAGYLIDESRSSIIAYATPPVSTNWSTC